MIRQSNKLLKLLIYEMLLSFKLNKNTCLLIAHLLFETDC